MTDARAHELLRSIYDRWQRLETEKQSILDDLKELFSEAKAHGFDGKALRAAFRRTAKLEDAEERAKIEEHDELVDLYVSALTRDAREEINPITGEILDQCAVYTAPASPHAERGADESSAQLSGPTLDRGRCDGHRSKPTSDAVPGGSGAPRGIHSRGQSEGAITTSGPREEPEMPESLRTYLAERNRKREPA